MAIKAVISNLPNNGGSAITGLQYRINEGSPVDFPAATVGTYDTTAVVDDEVQIRAVNAVGPGAWSTAKVITSSSTELVLNPSFADTSVWAGTDGTTDFSISGGNLTINDRGPDFTHGVSQNIAFDQATYTVTVTLVSATNSGMRVKVGFGLDAFDIPEMNAQTVPGTYTGTYVSPTAGTRAFILSTASPTSTAVISEVSVRLAP